MFTASRMASAKYLQLHKNISKHKHTHLSGMTNSVKPPLRPRCKAAAEGKFWSQATAVQDLNSLNWPHR